MSVVSHACMLRVMLYAAPGPGETLFSFHYVPSNPYVVEMTITEMQCWTETCDDLLVQFTQL